MQAKNNYCVSLKLLQVIYSYKRYNKNIKGERSGNMANEVSDLLTVEELCEKLQVSRNKAYQLLENGEIEGFKVGRNWRIPRTCW